MSRFQNISVIFILSFFVFCCEPSIEPERTFLIYKGDHYSSPRLVETLQSQKIVFDARFDETAVYNLGDPASQSEKNKLLGFSDCNSLHHENSARFAWQWFNNRLEIYAYCYVNKVRMEEFIGVVKINEYNHYELEINGDHYAFRLNNEKQVNMPRGTTCNTGVYYILWPYFGGQIPAPHDVSVTIMAQF